MALHPIAAKKILISDQIGQDTSCNLSLYSYQAYGLIIHSELRLPQLLSVEKNEPADIVVSYGTVPQSLENPTKKGVNWEISAEQFGLNIDGVAKYWVNGSEEVWIERYPNASDDDVRLFLLGSTLGFILHLRHILPLHASAIRTERGAVLFTGVSGAGKSTTLSAMVQRGYPMMADDVSGIVLDARGNPQVLSAFPASKLFADSVAKLNRSTDDLSQVKASLNKYLLPIDNFWTKSVPLYAVYVLTKHEGGKIELQPVEKNIDKLSCFLLNTYRKLYVTAIGWEQEQFKLISQAIKQTRVVRVTRPTQGFLLNELVEILEADFTSQS